MLFCKINLNSGTPKFTHAELPTVMNWNRVPDTYFQIIAIEVCIKMNKTSHLEWLSNLFQ